jgi:serine/threonine protein phosphatase PrpC
VSKHVPQLLVAAVTDVGKVRSSNEDSHWFDADAGLAIVCDGMGGHQAGEVASALAVKTVRTRWTGAELDKLRVAWMRTGTPQARRALIEEARAAVLTANQAIIELSGRDRDKHGMGTTFTGAMFLGGEVLIMHAGDSRAYLVREGVATRITEDHTLLARLADAGVEPGPEAARWKGVVTNALGIGEPTWVATAAVPVADGDRFVLCSDGVSEYVDEPELGLVLAQQPSPAKAARKLVDLALERGGHDNATVVVVKVVEVGAPVAAPKSRKREAEAVAKCPLFADLSPPRRWRTLRIATEHLIENGEPLPARFLGDRVSWIVLAGTAVRGEERGREGAILYAESLATNDAPLPTEWTARGPVRALAIRADDLAELASDEPDLGEKLYAALALMVGARRPKRITGDTGEF